MRVAAALLGDSGSHGNMAADCQMCACALPGEGVPYLPEVCSCAAADLANANAEMAEFVASIERTIGILGRMIGGPVEGPP